MQTEEESRETADWSLRETVNYSHSGTEETEENMKGRQEGEKRRKEESKGGREMNGETGAREWNKNGNREGDKEKDEWEEIIRGREIGWIEMVWIAKWNIRYISSLKLKIQLKYQ